MHVTVVYSEVGERRAHEPSERIVADAGDEGTAATEARGGDGDIGCAAAEELAECLYLLEPDPGLEWVKVDPTTTDSEDIPAGAAAVRAVRGQC